MEMPYGSRDGHRFVESEQEPLPRVIPGIRGMSYTQEDWLTMR
jgi:hypothetical protein